MAVSKTTEKKPAVKKTASKAVTAKAAKPKSIAVKKTSKINPEQRYKMVEMAAYFIAERHAFSGNPSEYWIEAEAQIEAMLSK